MSCNKILGHKEVCVSVFVIMIFQLTAFGQCISLLPQPPISFPTFEIDKQEIIPMPIENRMQGDVVPLRGICSIFPGMGKNDMLMSGNGKMQIQVSGNPTFDRITFQHERLLIPWKMPFEAPHIAWCLPEIQKLILSGKYQQALELSFEAATKAGMPPGTQNHFSIPAFIMNVEQPGTGTVTNYLRTVDFESGEIKVLWEDENGQWERHAFVSRPDSVVVQLFQPPEGHMLNMRISLDTYDSFKLKGEGSETLINPDMSPDFIHFEKDFNDKRLIIKGHFNPETGNYGYASVVRIILNGGTAGVSNGDLIIEGADSLMLLTRVEWYEDFQEDKINTLVQNLNKLTSDYWELLFRNRKVQFAIFNRASLNFDTSSKENAMSGEELLADQKLRQGYNLTLLSKLFDMSRYWLMLESGDFPPIYGHLNINVNLQVSGGEAANLPEAMNAFYNWIEKILPDSRNNAKNIFGARGILVSVHPDQQQGVLYHWDFAWPHHYWISAGGWVYSQFWEHYLATNDYEFLKNRIMPGLRELALFYEDYLKEIDENGNYIFVPSYSPENWPLNTEKTPSVINATMDIMVCRQVLTHLIEGAKTLGTDLENIPKWERMLAKMPPYLLDRDGALKEWSWPTLVENQDHRHISHLYGVWPADEITPDQTPQLAKAAWLANRKRAQGNGSGHGISHRMLVAARLKDNYLVNMELKQLLEQGYFGPVLTSSHNPYTDFMPDQQGSVLTLLIEMLVYSREGVIELLPAVPETITKGSIKGILSRSFMKVDELSWDLENKVVDVGLTSLREQDISLVTRYGIEAISAPKGIITEEPIVGAQQCRIHLPQNKPIVIHVKLVNSKPSVWVSQVN
ncbi:hypothetical protein C0T31_11335 [Dysgonamonadaceae bacterium]|nr:hypothetical protein C0T31_11335 [Dysgonamonadaceae bacterium]